MNLVILIVYSSTPLTVVGTYTGGLTNWLTNFGIVRGSSVGKSIGTGFAAETGRIIPEASTTANSNWIVNKEK
ncbi:MAG: hypothetical protein ACFFFB_14005 [Candidatus Heimdallarchaeota archaeon]